MNYDQLYHDLSQGRPNFLEWAKSAEMEAKWSGVRGAVLAEMRPTEPGLVPIKTPTLMPRRGRPS